MPSRVPTYRPPIPTEDRRRRYDRTKRDAASKSFYHTRAWLKLRLLKLAETPYCERCMAEDRLEAATVVHHMIELTDDPSLRLDLDNLQALCHSCHSRLHHGQKSSTSDDANHGRGG